MEKNIYAVTRQRYWPEGRPVVEIAYGGLDYCNPDALVTAYPGEFEEYTDPREAVKVGIAILKRWQKDGAKDATIAVGATLGFTMPFDSDTPENAVAWAEKAWESLPKCDRCGEVLPEKYYSNADSEWSDDKFCSEYCAEEAYRADRIETEG